MKKRLSLALILCMMWGLLGGCTAVRPETTTQDFALLDRGQLVTHTPPRVTPVPDAYALFVNEEDAKRAQERHARKTSYDLFALLDIPEPQKAELPSITAQPTTVSSATDRPNAATPTPKTLPDVPSSTSFELFGGVKTRYVLEQLTTRQRALFCELYDGYAEHMTTITLRGKYSYEDYQKVYHVFTMDCPELFHVENPGACYVNSSLPDKSIAYIVPEYNMTKSEYSSRFSSVLSIIRSIGHRPDFGSTDIQHELAIQSYLVLNVTYRLDSEARRADIAYLDGYAKCDGYSNATMLALRYYDIPCLNVTGWTQENDGSRSDMAHQWNMVRLNNCWYHLDTTWNDTDGDMAFEFETSEGVVKYLPYFNLSDAKILQARSIDMFNASWNIPAANDGSKSYFAMVGVNVPDDAYTQSFLHGKITKAYRSGVSTTILFFDDNDDLKAVIKSLTSHLNKWHGPSGERLSHYYYNYWYQSGLLIISKMEY